MSKICFYALGGINYKNGVITTCPRQADQLVFAHESILPSDIYNHKNFKKIREKLYNDIWPSGCDTCEVMEKNNLKSMRKDYVLGKDNEFYKNVTFQSDYHQDTALKITPNLMDHYNTTTHEVSNLGLRHLELRFSTACNFACLHCSNVYSSGWTKKLQKYVPDNEVEMNDLRQLLGTEHRHGPNDKSEMRLSTEQALGIVDDLNENFPNLSMIDFAGGELLYQKQFFPVLKRLSDHPNAKNMHISFHTNFNADFDVKKLSDLLYPFKESTIIISVDAGKTFYSYFRHGGKWDKLKQNIKEFRSCNDFSWIDISCTTSIYQMLDIYDVFESFIELECSVDASIVQTPLYLDPSLILFDYGDETQTDLDRTQKMIEKNYKNKKKIVSSKDGRIYWVDHRETMQWFNYIVDYIKKTKTSYRDFNRWLVYRKKSDEIWNQNFNDFFKNYQIEDNELIRVK